MKLVRYLFITLLTISLIVFILGENITLKPFCEQKGYFKEGVSKLHGFLSSNECMNISRNIHQNSYIGDNPLNEGFEKTRGIIFDFDVENAKELLSSRNCDDLYNIFERIRKPYANRFIMNVLIIDNATIKSLEEDPDDEMAVEYHYDTTLQEIPEEYIWGLERSYIPECVSVVYVDLPESFEGGELDICSYFYHRDIELVKPELGMLLEFNGKYVHGVYKMDKVYPKKSKRISIVLEQYSI